MSDNEAFKIRAYTSEEPRVSAFSDSIRLSLGKHWPYEIEFNIGRDSRETLWDALSDLTTELSNHLKSSGKSEEETKSIMKDFHDEAREHFYREESTEASKKLVDDVNKLATTVNTILKAKVVEYAHAQRTELDKTVAGMRATLEKFK